MSEITESAAVAADSAPEKATQTYGDIVWGQFKKNRVAYASLWGLALLFLLAIFAPLFASSTPFIWTDETGTSYPWFTTLFDTQYFENGVDLFFNLVMVMGMPLRLDLGFPISDPSDSGGSPQFHFSGGTRF